ncbi:MAG: hypothetical protein M3P52_00970, partial [Actinomycetota bacterium]|nr:hypothetical protein [Actinomycetota bacterium]
MRRKSLVAIFAAAALIGAACGDDDKTATTDAGTAASAADTAAAGIDTTAAEPATTAATEATTAAPSSEGPIVIGAAIDLTGNMAPFDAPALASA